MATSSFYSSTGLAAEDATALEGYKTQASDSADAAAASAADAATAASNASTSASDAGTYAGAALSEKNLAVTAKNNADTAATNAANSAAAAATSASSASASLTGASQKATESETSATASATSATNAATSATASATSATAASTAQTAAESARDSAQASYDDFDDRYLGARTLGPSTDNDGDTLVVGALYFSTLNDSMKVWTGSAWTAAYAGITDGLIKTNNLNDLSSVSSARTNLGLGTAATTDSTAYATAAQGAAAVSALAASSLNTTKLNGIDNNANNYVLPFTDNSSNWNTAFGWGNHATQSYATETYVDTEIAANTGGSGASASMSTNLDMNNNDIFDVHLLKFNDPGWDEGVEWSQGNGWKICEAPNNQTNAAGNLQFATGTTRRATLDTTGSLWTHSQGTLLGSSVANVITHDSGLKLRTSTQGAGTKITFTDNPNASYDQEGTFTYFHADSASYGSKNSFIFDSTEDTCSVVAKDKLLFGSLYIAPNSGTGAGTLLCDNNGNITASGLNVDSGTLYVDATNNNVGIGTTSPSAVGSKTTTNIKGSAGAALRLSDDTANATLDYVDGSGAALSVNAQESLTLKTNSLDRFTIDQHGRCGIGITDPSADLQINGTNNTVARFTNGTVSADVGTAGTSHAYVGTNTNHPLVFGANNYEHMRLDQNGNLGIGTTLPDEVLEVSGDVKSSGGNFGIYHFGETSDVTKIVGRDANHGSFPNIMDFFTNSTQRMRIDASGNVGIGTSSPSGRLHVSGDSDTTSKLTLQRTGATPGTVVLGYNYVGSTSNNHFRFFANSAEAMRIDSSGKLLVGTTDTTLYNNGASGNTGLVIDPNGPSAIVRSGNPVIHFNRLDSDGDVVQFRKNGETKGRIGIKDGQLYIGKDSVGLMFDMEGNDGIRPFHVSNQAFRDSGIDLGGSSAYFDDVYADNYVSSSDRNLKQDIEPLSAAEQRVAVAAKGLLRKYRLTSSVAEKGGEARVHFGIIAQDLEAAFKTEGLDPSRYAMWCSNTWTDEKTGEEITRQSIRYSQLLAFIISVI